MKIYVCGYNNAGAGGRFIKWFSFGRYTHVSLLFVKDNLASFEIESIQGAGVRRVSRGDDYPCDRYFVDCTPEQAATILHTAESLIGCKYDWSGIYGFLRRKKRENPKKWFCSELVAYCLYKAGIILMRLPAWKQSPVMVCSSVAIKQVENI